MKGGGTLALLVGLAVVAGVVLSFSHRRIPTDLDSDRDRPAAELYVEGLIGLPFRTAPQLEIAPQEVLLDEIGTFLDEQFGPAGLTRRTRAYELLGLVPPASNLRSEMIAMEAAGVRGWFNPRSGRILVPSNFDQDEPHDLVALHGLLTRALLYQHRPPATAPLADDEWFARRALAYAIAGSVEAISRKANPEPFRIPMPYETEREATILSLPTLLHCLAQFQGPTGQARIFAEARVETGASALTDLIRTPPRSTFAILGGDPAALSAPQVPALGQSLLEESLGALSVQTLLEWLDDFERARVLALLWRGDRYRLYADEWGDHLVWIATWHSPEAATRAGEILTPQEDPPGPDQPAESRRHHALHVVGKRTIFANCGSAESLATLLVALDIPGSPPASSSP